MLKGELRPMKPKQSLFDKGTQMPTLRYFRRLVL